MLGTKNCPYCEEKLERGLLSGESDLYPGLKYIGCAECGKTSLFYIANSKVTPIIGDPNGVAIELTKKDIAASFRKQGVMPIFKFDLDNAIDNKKKERNMKITFDGAEGTLEIKGAKEPLKDESDNALQEDGIAKIQELMNMIGVFGSSADITKILPTVLEKEESLDNDDSREEIKSLLGAIAKDVLNQIKEVEEPTPAMSCRTFENAAKENCKATEEKKSYVVIDEYDTQYLYMNVTPEELMEKMDEDHDVEDEELRLFELNPVEFSVKKTIEIR